MVLINFRMAKVIDFYFLGNNLKLTEYAGVIDPQDR